jgi:hypothetical protein
MWEEGLRIRPPRNIQKVDKKKAFYSAGGSVMALAISAFLSGWPEFLRAHGWIVWSGMAVSLILLAIGYFVPAKAESEASIVSINTGNAVGGDNSGKMIAHVEHYHEAPSQSSPEPHKFNMLDVHSASPQPPLRLELSLETISLTYRLEHCAWDEASQFDHDRREAIVAWFRNPVPLKGISGVDASQLSAHIRYSVDGHWNTQVSRGYWLHYSANEITIKIADRAGLIIGLSEWSRWVSYSNPYSQPANEEFLQPALRHPGKKVEMPKADMVIEVSLLSHGTVTLDQQQICLTFTNGRPFAVRVP